MILNVTAGVGREVGMGDGYMWFPRGSSGGFRLSAVPAGSRVAVQFEALFGITPAEASAVRRWLPEHAAEMARVKREAAEAVAEGGL